MHLNEDVGTHMTILWCCNEARLATYVFESFGRGVGLVLDAATQTASMQHLDLEFLQGAQFIQSPSVVEPQNSCQAECRRLRKRNVQKGKELELENIWTWPNIYADM